VPKDYAPRHQEIDREYQRQQTLTQDRCLRSLKKSELALGDERFIEKLETAIPLQWSLSSTEISTSVETISVSTEQKETISKISTKQVNNFSNLEGLRLVVVDDDVDTLELITFILEEYNVQVTTATSASEALKAIARSSPDIIISDIAMPGEDGYSLMRKVRSLEPEQGGHIPAIALTAFAREEDRILALDAGFQRHIPKPVDPFELVAVVAKLAEQSQQ
jgi:CheY-like chemotaxis protein